MLKVVSFSWTSGYTEMVVPNIHHLITTHKSYSAGSVSTIFWDILYVKFGREKLQQVYFEQRGNKDLLRTHPGAEIILDFSQNAMQCFDKRRQSNLPLPPPCVHSTPSQLS